MQEGLAGYTEGMVGSKERLANTETFRSYLGDVVIPGLKDFGGSDTVEELKYLQGVYAGDTTAQPKALKNMLERAENKIKAKELGSQRYLKELGNLRAYNDGRKKKLILHWAAWLENSIKKEK